MKLLLQYANELVEKKELAEKRASELRQQIRKLVVTVSEMLSLCHSILVW